MRSWPLRGSRHSGAPVGGSRSCQLRLRAERGVMMYTAPSGPRNALYSPSGSAQQLVCPYMVSGRSVAASRNTGPAPCHNKERETVESE